MLALLCHFVPSELTEGPKRNSVTINEPVSVTNFCLPKHNVSPWQLLLVPSVSLWQFIAYESFISVRQGMKISWNDQDSWPRCGLNEQRLKCASLCFSMTHFCDFGSWDALSSQFLIPRIPTYSAGRWLLGWFHYSSLRCICYMTLSSWGKKKKGFLDKEILFDLCPSYNLPVNIDLI